MKDNTGKMTKEVKEGLERDRKFAEEKGSVIDEVTEQYISLIRERMREKYIVKGGVERENMSINQESIFNCIRGINKKLEELEREKIIKKAFFAEMKHEIISKIAEIGMYAICMLKIVEKINYYDND